MGALLLGLLLVLIFFGVPIGFTILLSSALFLQITDLKPLIVVAQKLALGLDSSSLLAIPLFTLMGSTSWKPAASPNVWWTGCSPCSVMCVALWVS